MAGISAPQGLLHEVIVLLLLLFRHRQVKISLVTVDYIYFVQSLGAYHTCRADVEDFFRWSDRRSYVCVGNTKQYLLLLYLFL
jgi:hypothetical protein